MTEWINNVTVPEWLAIFVVAGVAVRGARYLLTGSAEAKPRPPADVSPFFAALVTGWPQPAYTAKFTAITPDGITVTGRCPHRGGHRTPAQARDCADREKDRIERTGW